MSLNISQYKPGRFEYLMKEPFAVELWSYLSDEKQTGKLFRATEEELPAIEYILDEVEDRFEEQLKSEQYPDDDIPTFINNMIKQIMEHHGYKHAACGLCFTARFINSSGVYSKKG